MEIKNNHIVSSEKINRQTKVVPSFRGVVKFGELISKQTSAAIYAAVGGGLAAIAAISAKEADGPKEGRRQESSTGLNSGTSRQQKKRERASTTDSEVIQERANVKDALEELKASGINSECINKTLELVESGTLDMELGQLQMLVNNILTSLENQNGSEAVYLNEVFNCSPEDLPNKIKAYMYAKILHLDKGKSLKLISSSDSDYTPSSAALNFVFTPEETKHRYQDLLNILTDEKLKTILTEEYEDALKIDDGDISAVILEGAIEIMYRYLYTQELIKHIKDKTLFEDLQKIISGNLGKQPHLTDIMFLSSTLESILGLNTIFEDSSPSETFLINLKLKALDGDKLYEELSKTPEEIKDEKLRMVRRDMDRIDKYQRVLDLCTVSPKSETAATEYEKYLKDILSTCEPKTAERIKKLCHEIEKDCGMRVFLSSDMKEAGVALKLIYMELANYKMRAQSVGETANIPPVLNLCLANAKYFAPKKDPKDITGGSYSHNNNSISINGSRIANIKWALRHELMHANDTKRLDEFPKGFDPIVYIDELLTAGLYEEEIHYALTNPREFIAKAAQGDMSKYSDEFKAQLVELGMPRWATDMNDPVRSIFGISAEKRLRLVLEFEKFYYKKHPEWEQVSWGDTTELMSDEEIQETMKWLRELALYTTSKEHKPDKETEGETDCISGADIKIREVLDSLDKSALDDDEKALYRGALAAGLIDPETCLDFLKSDFARSSSITVWNIEDVVEKMKAYRYGKTSNMLPIELSILMTETDAETPLDIALAKMRIKQHLVSKYGMHAYQTRNILDNLTAANYGLYEKNSELIEKYSYWFEYLYEENIEKLKLLDEYEKTTGRTVFDHDAIAILLGEDEGKELFAEIKKELSLYKQASEKLNSGEKLSPNDFMAIILSDNKVNFNSRGINAVYEVCEDTVKFFINEHGEVPPFAVEFLRKLCGDSGIYGIKTFLTSAVTNRQNFKQRTLNEEDMNKILSSVQIILDSGLSLNTTLDFLSECAVDEEGNFSAALVAELIKKGTTIEEIKDIFDTCKYRFRFSKENLYKVYNAMLDVKRYTIGLPDKITEFIYTYIFEKGGFTNIYYILNRYNEFKENPEGAVNFVKQACNDKYLSHQSISLPFPITESVAEAYRHLPDADKVTDNNRYNLIEALSFVNENNLELFKACIDYDYTELSDLKYAFLTDLLEFASDSKTVKLTLSLVPLLRDKSGKVDMCDLEKWAKILGNAPELTAELVENNVSLLGLNPSELYTYIMGNETNNIPPLNKEQRNFLYELLSYKGSDGYRLMPISEFSHSREYLLELKPENYDIVKKFMSNGEHYFNNVAKDLCEFQEAGRNLIDKLKTTIAENPELIKHFDVETLIKYPDRAQLLLQNRELFESLEKIKYLYSPIDFIIMNYTSKDIESGFKAIENIPEDIKQKYPKALGEIYILELCKQIANVKINAKDFIEILERISKYDDRTRTVIEIHCVKNAPHLGSCTQETLDFAAKYIENHPEIYEIEEAFLHQILFSDKNLNEAKQKVDELLVNKDEIIKRIRIGLKDTDSEYFIRFVREFLDSEQAYFMMFLPNLSFDSVVGYFLESAKIFYRVNALPQNFINGEFDEKIIEALHDYRKKGEQSEIYTALEDTLQMKVQTFDNQISTRIEDNLYKILQAVAITDAGALQQLLDQHFEAFNMSVNELLSLSDREKIIVSDLIRNARKINRLGQPVELSGKQKLDMITIAKYLCKNPDFDIEQYKTPIKSKKRGKYVLDIKRLYKDILNAVLASEGISPEEAATLNPENLHWNPKYCVSLSCRPGRDKGELADLIREGTRGNFENYINDPSNKYGQANIRTQQAFQRAKLDFTEWETPDIDDIKIIINDKEYTIKLWGRHPQEDLFMGSKTSCCTALDGGNGAATANYILNKAFNVIFLYNSDGEIVGMSRVFMANIDGKPALIMDNIELEQKYKYGSDSVKTAIRDGLFQYAHKLAQAVTGDDTTKVYFSTSYTSVNHDDLTQVTKSLDFIGSLSRDDIYFNMAQGWPEYQKLVAYDFYEVPKVSE